MTKKEFQKFLNREYDIYRSNKFTLGQVARNIEHRIQRAKNTVELLNMFRNDVSAHVTSGTESRLDETFDQEKHTHNCANGPPQFG